MREGPHFLFIYFPRSRPQINSQPQEKIAVARWKATWKIYKSKTTRENNPSSQRVIYALSLDLVIFSCLDVKTQRQKITKGTVKNITMNFAWVVQSIWLISPCIISWNFFTATWAIFTRWNFLQRCGTLKLPLSGSYRLAKVRYAPARGSIWAPKIHITYLASNTRW